VLVIIGRISPFELFILALEFLDVALPPLHLGVDLNRSQSQLLVLKSETRQNMTNSLVKLQNEGRIKDYKNTLLLIIINQNELS
jgi:hypothetical protein